MKQARYLVYDIETIPESESAQLWIDKRGNPDEFPPIPAHKIVSIGTLEMDREFKVLKAGTAGVCGGRERDHLKAFLDLIGPETRLVDWNGRGFDMPVIQSRCFRYGIQIPFYFAKQKDNYGKVSSWSKEYRDRYGGLQIDVRDEWTNRGAFRETHLAELAVLMGLPGKTDMDGSKVYEAWALEKFKEIDRYCMQDVYQTACVFLRFLHLRGLMTDMAYRSAVAGVLRYAESADSSFYRKVHLDRVMLNEAQSV